MKVAVDTEQHKNTSLKSLPYKKVLMCDPDEEFRHRLVAYFSSKQAQIIEYLDATDYMQMIDAFRPDVIFIDVAWLVESAPCFLQDVKAKFAQIMCVLTLGPDFIPATHTLLKQGADGFLCKNIIDMSLLDHVMKNFFKRRKNEEEKKYYSRLLEEQITELKKSRNQIAQESRDKLLFIKQLSSNLQLPLNQLIQFAHIGLERIHRKQTMLVGSYLAEIKLISEELLIYINDLKEISLLKTGESEFNLEEIDLGEFLKAIERQFQPIADSRHVNLSFHIHLPNPCVMADYNKLTKVINILLRNAFRYLPSKGTVDVKAYEKDGKIYLMITDDGPGIPEEQRARLFNMYDQNRVQDRQGIMGFGLSICKELMLGQNGDIHLDNNETVEGSTFILTLPIAQSILD